jgi:hypothetical protein
MYTDLYRFASPLSEKDDEADKAGRSKGLVTGIQGRLAQTESRAVVLQDCCVIEWRRPQRLEPWMWLQAMFSP